MGTELSMNSSIFDRFLTTPASLLLCYFLALIVSISLARDIWLWYRLRHVPGPFFASISLLWLTKKCLGGNTHVEFQKLACKYGPVVRLSPNQVICSDPDSLIRISGVRSGYKKSQWYNAGRIEPGHRNLFSTLEPDERRERKSKITAAYHGTGNGGLEQAVDRGIKGWIDLIERKYVSTASEFRPMELSSRSAFFSLDTTCELAFSEPIGFLANDRDMFDVTKINLSMFKAINVLSNSTTLMSLLFTWPVKLLLPKDGDKSGFGSLIRASAQFIAERLQPHTKPKRDMLQSFINHGLTSAELRQETAQLFIAGSDTTAAAIRLLILNIISNPVAYRRLVDELGDAMAKGLVSSPIRDMEAKALPYFQATIRESLRTLPPVASGAFTKVVPEGGDTVNGYLLPAGTLVSSQAAYTIGRDRAFWGDDADMFRPERWMEVKDEETRQAMQRRVDLCFGHGQFQCMGKAIALMEINKVIPELFRRYDFAVVNPVCPLKMYTAVVWVVEDLWVTITRR